MHNYRSVSPSPTPPKKMDIALQKQLVDPEGGTGEEGEGMEGCN